MGQTLVKVELPVVASLGFGQPAVTGVLARELDENGCRGVVLDNVPRQPHPQGLAGESDARAGAPDFEVQYLRRGDQARGPHDVGQPVGGDLLDGLRDTDGKTSRHDWRVP